MAELYSKETDDIIDLIRNKKDLLLNRLADIELGKKLIKNTGANMNSYNHLFSLFNDPSIANILDGEFVDETGYDIVLNGKNISIKGFSELMCKRIPKTQDFQLVHTFGKRENSVTESLNNNKSDYVLMVQTKQPYSMGLTTYDIAKNSTIIKGPYAYSTIYEDDMRWIFKDEYLDKKEISNKLFETTIKNIIKLTSGDWNDCSVIV